MKDKACYGIAIPDPEIKKLQARLSIVEQKLREMEKKNHCENVRKGSVTHN